MTPERFQRVSELFEQCCEQDPLTQAAFLERACAGDDALRADVEALLRVDGNAPVRREKLQSWLATGDEP